MFARSDSRKTMLAVMLVIAVLAVAIPTCQMIGCDMGMCGGMMAISTHPGPSFGTPCSGVWMTNAGQVGIVSGELLVALIALLAAVAAVLAMAPRVHFQPVRLVDANAPPPPLEPRGERWIL